MTLCNLGLRLFIAMKGELTASEGVNGSFLHLRKIHSIGTGPNYQLTFDIKYELL